jgi:molybdopterin synthase catalytic subunit
MFVMSDIAPGLALLTPPVGDTWCGLSAADLPVVEVLAWANKPDCGAVVLFSGNARDHAPGRDAVTALEYEAYEEQAVPRLLQVAEDARLRWPAVRQVALLHRVGPLAIGEAAVLVVVSSPHRPEAFDAGRFCIDALKASVPIWKQETWAGGQHWGTDAQHVVESSRA